MQINSQSLDEIEQQTEDSLRYLNEMWQRSAALPTLQKQLLTEALTEHQLTLRELQVALEELRCKNEELAAALQVVEAQRQRYQDLFEFAPDAYLVTNPQAVILEANQAAANLLNYSQKSLVGKPMLVFVTGENRRDFLTQLSQLQSGKEAKEWEVQIQPRQGALFPAACRVVAVRDGEGQVVGLRWLLRDNTERKHYEAAVEEQKKLSRLKDDFLSTVSHELRTPLANMKMAIQMLGVSLNREQQLFAELAKPAVQQSRVARYFQILHNECEREIKLINNILDLQSINAGAQTLVLTSIQLQDWLPVIVKPFQERARNRQLELQITVSKEVPRLISDPASLERVLAQLLENACKYTPPHEQIIVTAQAQSGMMQLSVTNSGVEIPASDLPRIFDKFYRVPNADPWKQGGIGLGLTLVQQLVAHLGGKIHVESAAGQTRFTVELPLVKQHKEAGGAT